MSKNPVVPYAIIAILGIALVIILSYVGVNQREAIQNPEENADAAEETHDPEEIYQSSCAACHGGDLTGPPDLTAIGSKYSAEEIQDIINNGRGAMPPGQATPPQAEILADWLVENYK
ncbi:cytochrome c550 [Ornithinibacillus sp. 4-3]|uniref:Cytochrome c550 n=1 Tax=Ornithinibacillus sp. 4-3 TaxID=3231488 RepID=A0AB39HL47_9BACI